MDLQRVLVSLLVAILALFAVGVGVTAVLDAYVWPSLLVGIPAGLVAAVLAGALAYRRQATPDGRETV